MLYQTLAALWGSAPADELESRLTAYMEKAAREAKIHTSWVNPNSAYEADLSRFVRAMLQDRWVARALEPVVGKLASYGYINSLSQLVLKCTCPGVPDFYQGCELLDLSLVDPDNRRPVDFGRRQRLLAEIEPLVESPDLATLQKWVAARDERGKLYLTARLLRFRGKHPQPFSATYRALGANGPAADHVVAFTRSADEADVTVVVPRFPVTLEQRGGYRNTHLELPTEGPWWDVLSDTHFDMGHELPLERLPLPWAVLLHQKEC